MMTVATEYFGVDWHAAGELCCAVCLRQLQRAATELSVFLSVVSGLVYRRATGRVQGRPWTL